MISIRLLTLLMLFNEHSYGTCCGQTADIPIQLVANGHKSYHGQWPWLVSLFKYNKISIDTFFCSASLINEWTLVTGKPFKKYFTWFSCLFHSRTLLWINQARRYNSNFWTIKYHQWYWTWMVTKEHFGDKITQAFWKGRPCWFRYCSFNTCWGSEIYNVY